MTVFENSMLRGIFGSRGGGGLKDEGENYTLKGVAPITKYYCCDQIKEDGIGEIHCMPGGEMKRVHNVSEESESYQRRYVRISRRIILKCIIRKYDIGV
jgi:hypothetical protein